MTSTCAWEHLTTITHLPVAIGTTQQRVHYVCRYEICACVYTRSHQHQQQKTQDDAKCDIKVDGKCGGSPEGAQDGRYGPHRASYPLTKAYRGEQVQNNIAFEMHRHYQYQDMHKH